MSMNEITILSPDDWHCHLRDESHLATTVPAAAKQFKRVIVMPNLAPPVTTVKAALEYRDRILQYAPERSDFTPLMTLYLTDDSSPKLIEDAKSCEAIIGCKLYPAHVTTGSSHGVTNIEALYPTLEAMQKAGLPILIHGEVNTPDVDIFDRERVFLESILSKLTEKFPDLKIVLEHITSKAAVDFIKASAPHVVATITPHHLYSNRNALLVGGIHPHYYCLPILKRKEDQQALIQAAISGNPQFFIGTDSAPHAKNRKESSCGCAGIFHSYAMSIYAHVFEIHDALDKLEGFSSRFGAQFYGLPPHTSTITLRKNAWVVPESIPFGNDRVLPFLAGETLAWEQINLWA